VVVGQALGSKETGRREDEMRTKGKGERRRRTGKEDKFSYP
jgi:hypothetical protein